MYSMSTHTHAGVGRAKEETRLNFHSTWLAGLAKNIFLCELSACQAHNLILHTDSQSFSTINHFRRIHSHHHHRQSWSSSAHKSRRLLFQNFKTDQLDIWDLWHSGQPYNTVSQTYKFLLQFSYAMFLLNFMVNRGKLKICSNVFGDNSNFQGETASECCGLFIVGSSLASWPVMITDPTLTQLGLPHIMDSWKEKLYALFTVSNLFRLWVLIVYGRFLFIL